MRTLNQTEFALLEKLTDEKLSILLSADAKLKAFQEDACFSVDECTLIAQLAKLEADSIDIYPSEEDEDEINVTRLDPEAADRQYRLYQLSKKVEDLWEEAE